MILPIGTILRHGPCTTIIADIVKGEYVVKQHSTYDNTWSSGTWNEFKDEWEKYVIVMTEEEVAEWKARHL
jgi:hypothetical protein